MGRVSFAPLVICAIAASASAQPVSTVATYCVVEDFPAIYFSPVFAHPYGKGGAASEEFRNYVAARHKLVNVRAYCEGSNSTTPAGLRIAEQDRLELMKFKQANTKYGKPVEVDWKPGK
ncbi:hypothetical protein [Sphingomonas sp. Leaf67]|uniref:hypothetical protein n=1 Tax=Sphingomonas sp. Leaf67 TaxID=1736230 RepID=UPI00138F42C2|nr:hypothetical protein [Sphingomonas sp. Leaf67]